MLKLIRTTVHRARKEHLAQIAGSLTFTTLLSIAPFFAVSFALFTRFPVFHQFQRALEDHLLKSMLPGDLSRTVLRYLQQFALNANGLTLVGSLLLLGAVMAMLLTIENAFNQIWNVRRSRPLLRRLSLYLLVVAVGPPALAVSLWATSTLIGASLGWIGSLPASASFVLNLGPVALSWLGLACLFRWLPNTRVRWRDAIVGSLLASIALELGKRGFANYLVQVPTYQTVYGAFAVLPVFLLWLYFSWLVTLGAALVTAGLGGVAARRGVRA